ncbi:BQ5605_C001g00349 [Microbotryum silenes-dioicae]|uniref:BQ5605_C001g00349 protein n=1 Tax=Microbotryum silenes-dioicae TaxID=796604 RepID=A0A2X0M6I0_9BASI|nr:BQ5605_C001g00349 [Microbotryum silenes-dioicae]
MSPPPPTSIVQSSAKEPTSVGSDQTSTTLAPSPANQSTLPHSNVGRPDTMSRVGKCMTMEEAIEAARPRPPSHPVQPISRPCPTPMWGDLTHCPASVNA